jgi:hypothetical protein
VWQLCCLGEFLVISMIHLLSSEVVARCGLDFLCAGYSAGSEPPHARQVQRGGGQRKLRSYFSQPAHPESPHPSLFFQNSYNRLSQRFPSSV